MLQQTLKSTPEILPFISLIFTCNQNLGTSFGRGEGACSKLLTFTFILEFIRKLRRLFSMADMTELMPRLHERFTQEISYT